MSKKWYYSVKNWFALVGVILAIYSVGWVFWYTLFVEPENYITITIKTPKVYEPPTRITIDKETFLDETLPTGDYWLINKYQNFSYHLFDIEKKELTTGID